MKRLLHEQGDNSSSSLERWSGLSAVLAGTLFSAWGYLHSDAAPPVIDAIVGALGLVVPLLFLIGLTGLYAWYEEQAGCVGRLGFFISFAGAGMGTVYHILDVFGIVDGAARYGYLVGRGWPPYLFHWFYWLVAGLTLVGMVSIASRAFRSWALLSLAIGLFGDAYSLSDYGGIHEMRLVHVSFGVLFSLSWAVLGYLLWIGRAKESIGEQPGKDSSKDRP